MKRNPLVPLLTLALVATFNSSAYAQTAWSNDLAKGAAAMQAGNVDSAEKLFQKAYDAASAANDQASICQAALQLGIVKTTLHKTADAEKLFRTALQIGSRAMDANSPFAALTSSLLADLLLTEGRPAEAETLYEKSIPNLPANPPNLAAEKTINLALCYTRNDKYDAAAKAFEKGIAAFTAIGGPDSSETLTATVNFATFEYERANYEKAAALAERVLKSKNDNKNTHATANNVLAHIYDKTGKYGLAMKIAQQSSNEYENSNATDAIKEADAELLIGRIYKDGHKYKEAESIINKVVKSLAVSSPDNPDYSDALREKGDLLVLQGQYEKAETFINQSKAIREKYLGREHSDVAQTLEDLGYIYQQENRYNESETAYKTALQIFKKVKGEKHPDYISVLAKLGELYRLMNKPAEAENALTSVLEVRRATAPAGSTDVSKTIDSLATLFEAGQKPEKAERLLSEVVDQDAKQGASPAKKASDLQRLAVAQQKQGKQVAANATQKKADQIIATLFGATSSAATTVPPSTTAQTATADNTPIGNKWCLSIGISNFKDSSINLKYSAKDATDFSNFVVAKGNFKPDHVRLLTDERATRQNIVDALGEGWLAKQVKPDDLVMIYVSTHGSQSLDEAGGVNFLVTYDANQDNLLTNGIPMQWLSTIISKQIKCKRTVIILDVCHSGSAADWTEDSAGTLVATADGARGGGGGGAAGGKGLARGLVSDPEAVKPGSGQIILCSSSKSQTSWESKEYPNSVFTKRLIDAMRSNGENTKLAEAFAPLKSNVESEVLRDRSQVQTPQINGTWQGSSLAPLSR